jgi:hypothetical protein
MKMRHWLHRVKDRLIYPWPLYKKSGELRATIHRASGEVIDLKLATMYTQRGWAARLRDSEVGAIILVNNGEEWAAERLAGVQGAGTNNVFGNAGSHCGWGTGAGTAAKADTTLFTESGDPATRPAATTITVTGTGASAKYQHIATIPSTTTQTITNAGILSANTAGVLFTHADFAGIPLVNGDSIQFTWTIDPS